MAYTLTNNEYFIKARNISKGSIYPHDEKILKNIFINTFSLYDIKDSSISLSEDAVIRIYVNILIPTNSVNFSLKIDNVETEFIWNRTELDLNGYNTAYGKCNNMNVPNNSYMLLRVNPKLSGNVKVVVDSNSNLYLDSFKVNPELSKRKYRKIPISYKDYYGRNISAFANNLPTYNYFYEVPENYHKLFTVVSDYKEQYVDTYRYGVTTNTDKLYDENFSILAPLSVGKIIPDFFIVFKVNGVVDLTKSMSDISIMKKLLKESTFVKSFDLRKNSKLGTYVRTIRDKSKNTIGSLYVSYNPKQFNTYTGIALDKGTVSTIYESPYSLKYKNQVQSDNFYTLGFERNHIVSDHIINFEYMFNDEDSDMFSINTYFGLYIKINENSLPCYYINNDIYQIDGQLPKGLQFDVNTPENNDLLYCFSDEENCYRIDSSLKGFKNLNIYNNRLGENILSSKVNKIYDSSNGTNKISYITFQLNDIIEPGEHFKIIHKENSHNINIYEIVFSNYEKYKNKGISRTIVNTGTSEDENVNYTFYRISIYSEFRDELNKSITIEKQIENITDALYAFIKEYNAPILFTYSKNRIGIYSDKIDLTFERICNMCSNGVDSSIEDNTINYFNINNKIDASILKISNCDDSNEYFYANNFELLGDRRTYIVNFKNTQNKNAYNLSVDNIDSYSEYNKFLFIDSSVIYDIENLNKADFSFTNPNKKMFLLDKELINEDKTNFYLPYTWNFGIASIFNIKDFNFNVLDNYSDIAMPGEDKRKITDKNNYIDFDVLENDASLIIKNIPSEAFSSYISETDSVPLYSQINVTNITKETITIIDSSDASGKITEDISVYHYDHPTELSMNKYLKFKYDRNVNKSYISLTSPYNCKWTSVGTDCIANNSKLTYNNNFLVYDASSKEYTYSYMIPVDLNDEENTKTNKIFSSLMGFTYVPKISGEEYKKYFSNMLESNIDSSTSFRNSIFKGLMSIDNLLYTNNNYKNKFSKVYFRGDNTLEFISSGVKFNIKFISDSIVDLKKYNNYNGIFISTIGKNTYNNSDIELFIDEINENVVLIWHQPVYSLRYKHTEDPIEYSSSLYAKRIPLDYNTNMIYQSNDSSIVIPTYTNIDSNIKNCEIFTTSIDTNITDWKDYEKLIFILKSNSVNKKKDNENVDKLYSKNNSLLWIGKNILNKPVSDYNNKLSEVLNTNIELLNDINISYLVGDSSSALKQYESHLTYSDLKNHISNCVIYIKTEKGLKYYDNEYNNLYSINVIDPIEETFIKTNRTPTKYSGKTEKYKGSKFFVHPTYYEPEMINMLTFEYNDSSLCEHFSKNYHLSNIRLKDVANIDQIWYNKLSSDLNYCFNSNYTAFGLGIDVDNNYSILSSVWSEKFFNKYSRDKIQDEYDKKNLEGQTDFIINELSYGSDENLYDYLPKVPKYLISNTLDLADVKSNVKLNKEVFNSSSYDSSILYVYNEACDGSTLYSNCIESPNFKKSN